MALTVAAPWVLRCAYFSDVTNDRRKNGSYSNDGENYTNPPVPNFCCNHDVIVANNAEVSRLKSASDLVD